MINILIEVIFLAVVMIGYFANRHKHCNFVYNTGFWCHIEFANGAEHTLLIWNITARAVSFVS